MPLPIMAPAATLPSGAESIKLDGTMGAMFIGTMLAGVLWGASCAQAYRYYSSYYDDSTYLKWIVAIVFLLDTSHQVLISQTLYYYLISNYFKPQALASIPDSLYIQVEINDITAFIVQCFFIWRIWRLSGKNYIISGVTFLAAVSSLVFTSIYVHRASGLTSFTEIPKIQELSALINITATVTDVLIAVFMIYLLHTSRSGLDRTNDIINRLLLFVINTGLLTSLCSVGALVSVLVMPQNLIYTCFFFPLGRLYTNSLLATLNARESFRNDFVAVRTSQFWISMTNTSGSGSTREDNQSPSKKVNISAHRTKPAPIDISVDIKTTTDTEMDSESPKHEGLDAYPPDHRV